VEAIEKKELMDELKEQWKTLWHNRLDDRVRAEGIADRDYSLLLIERGTVIIATRKFRIPDFYEILEHHRSPIDGKPIPPNPSVGGWGKFMRTALTSNNRKRSRRQAPLKAESYASQQLKKGGRGWLHIKA
jgi:hypothetical protein